MSLNIKIRDEVGFETKISVNPNMTIGDAKKLFFRYFIRKLWTHRNGILYNDKTFSDYRIKDGYILLLSQKSRGGA